MTVHNWENVEKLWMSSEFPVERATAKFIFHEIWNESQGPASRSRPSYFICLAQFRAVRKISAAPRYRFLTHKLNVVRHCFERIIAGRTLVIEVTWVAEKRWRAHIVRIPGVPTAMMPFYGETPDEAAAHLSDWLDRAYQYRANTV